MRIRTTAAALGLGVVLASVIGSPAIADNGSDPVAMVPSSTGDDIIGQQQIKDGNANSSYTPNTGVAGIANKNNFHDNKVASILFAP